MATYIYTGRLIDSLIDGIICRDTSPMCSVCLGP